MLNISLKCLKHPRYDPEKHGQAGIRGACKWCTQLYIIFQRTFDDWRSLGED